MKLADTPKGENEACEAVILEMRAFLLQEGAPPVAMTLLDEAAARIALRRLVSQVPTGRQE